MPRAITEFDVLNIAEQIELPPDEILNAQENYDAWAEDGEIYGDPYHDDPQAAHEFMEYPMGYAA